MSLLSLCRKRLFYGQSEWSAFFEGREKILPLLRSQNPMRTQSLLGIGA